MLDKALKEGVYRDRTHAAIDILRRHKAKQTVFKDMSQQTGGSSLNHRGEIDLRLTCY